MDILKFLNQLKTPYLTADGKFNASFPKAFRYQAPLDFQAEVALLPGESLSEKIYLLNHKKEVCKVCGRPTSFINYSKGYSLYCSRNCYKQSAEAKEKRQQTNLQKYGVPFSSQSDVVKEKLQQSIKKIDQKVKNKKREKTTIERYGVTHIGKLEKIKNQRKQTCLYKYGVETNLLLPEIKIKSNSQEAIIKGKINREKTCLIRYGVNSPMKVWEFAQKQRKSLFDHYGVTTPILNSNIRKKIFSHTGMTKAERILNEFLYNRGFDYQYQYVCNGKCFDFAIFKNEKLKLLIEVDGEYWHELLCDCDGTFTGGATDASRFLNTPEQTMLLVVDSKKIHEAFTEICKLYEINYDAWQEAILQNLPKEFPYPVYSASRLKKDYDNLCNRKHTKYNRIGMSIIRHFHPSIYSCNVKNKPSPVSAWESPELLKKCVENRFIYSSSLSSQSIADGFNVNKIAPKVSVFNPSLAKYLIDTYLPEVKEIFDPFSGFSGRMLGASAAQKSYVGQDLNAETVRESSKIIEYFKLKATIVPQNILTDSHKKYEALFTCPPYLDKETWGPIEGIYTAEQWIDICLEKYDCNTYLFVIDTVDKYKNYVVERLSNKSHFSSNNEYVILLKKGNSQDDKS